MPFMMMLIPENYESATPDAVPSAEAVAKMMEYNKGPAEGERFSSSIQAERVRRRWRPCPVDDKLTSQELAHYFVRSHFYVRASFSARETNSKSSALSVSCRNTLPKCFARLS
jgi:hypothetical protein